MSEITVETGELPVCVNCQLKHAVGLLHHVDPSLEKEKYSKTLGLINEIGEGLMMTSQEVEDFIAAYELEHKVEDSLTVLRDLRHKIMEGSEERFEALEEVGREMNKPGNPEIPEHCEFTKEKVKPKEYFDRDSFRTICPECPESRCSLCPPELACATRIITGCKEGEFVKGRCQVGTEAHVIYHGGNPGNPDEGYPEKVERWKRRRGLDRVAKDLADNDAVNDALFDLRGTILQVLKEMGEVAPDVTGPEVQGSIDYLIRRLVFLA